MRRNLKPIFRAQRLLSLIIQKHEATIAKSAAGLYAALSDYIKIMLLVGRLYVYAHLNSDTDKSDNKYLTLYGRAVNLLNEVRAATFFHHPVDYKN
jgi:oligoendopeptidase F